MIRFGFAAAGEVPRELLERRLESLDERLPREALALEPQETPFDIGEVVKVGQDNVVNGFSTGIFISDCRRGSCANNQLTGGTGTGINLSAGNGSYDIKVVACDVETTGQYCYHIGHQRNSLVGCSGRNSSTAIFYVTGAHNHIVSCETEAAFNADILRVEGNSHNIHDNDFSYTVSAGYYTVNLTATADRVFVHGNRLYQPGNFGTNSMIYDNVVNDVYKASGF